MSKDIMEKLFRPNPLLDRKYEHKYPTGNLKAKPPQSYEFESEICVDICFVDKLLCF